MKSLYRQLLGLAAATMLHASGAHAATVAPAGTSPNYTFPDRSIGFSLTTSGGVINPGVLVGFNPQPDPPGDQFLDLRNPLAPTVTVGSEDREFRFILSFTNISDFNLLFEPAKPNRDGRTQYGFCDGSVRPGEGGARSCDGSVFVADLAFSGPGGVSSWVAFNPQPEPPGDVVAYVVGFGADASVSLSLTENGEPLKFAAAPEPSTWALMGTGLATLGLLVRARRRVLRA